MSLVIPPTFQHILRVMNTNIDGKRNIMFAITAIKGVGRRYANLVLKKVSYKLKNLKGIFLKSTMMCRSRYSLGRQLEVD